jgi:hypothetical protein
MLHQSTENYVKRTYSQCVDVAIRQIVSVEDHCLETDVHSASSGVDAIDGHEVL